MRSGTRILCLLFSVCLLVLLPLHIHAERNISVYYRAATHTPKIALTFDDGPHPQYTDRILEVLEREGVRATFFVIGSNVRLYPEITKRVLAAGHEIGNHTYSHPLVPLTATEELEREVEQTDTLLLSLGIPRPVFFRPPQGKFPPDAEGFLERTGKIAVLWSIDTRDWAHTETEQMIREVEEKVGGGDIILFHDFVGGKTNTVDAIKKLIPTLRERGYQFVTLSELLLDGE